MITPDSKERQTFEGALLFSSDGRGQGSRLEDWEVVLNRHFNLLPCNSDFYVDDDWEREIAPFLPPAAMSPADPGGSGSDPAGKYPWLARFNAMDDEQKGDRLEFSIRAKFPVTVVSRNCDDTPVQAYFAIGGDGAPLAFPADNPLLQAGLHPLLFIRVCEDCIAHHLRGLPI